MTYAQTPDGRVKTVLFDLGNTLIYFDDHWPSIAPQANAALLAALRRLGFTLPDTDFETEIDRRMDAYYRERDSEFVEYTTAYVLRSLIAEKGYPEVTDEQLAPALRAMYAVSQAHWQAEADAIPALEDLRSQGLRLGLISNASDDTDVQTLIDKAGIRPYFEVIVTSAAAGIRKPHPRIFKDVLARLGASPGETVMVGDTLAADILGAQNVGMRSVWITRRADKAANRAHVDHLKPDATIAALSDLPGLIATWNRA